MTKHIGLIVNPIAGMGGSVGLKGTDGGERYQQALDLGAQPVTPHRTKVLLSHIEHLDQIHFLTGPGQMGERWLQNQNLPYKVVGKIQGTTTARDTQRIARKMVSQGAECLIFVGGDGTARDIYDAVDQEIPVVAVPSGVKMFSSAFATSPQAAARLVDVFIEGTDTVEEEVLDIDEDAFRQDTLASTHYGTLRVPAAPIYIQPGKAASQTGRSNRIVKEDIAAYVVEEMDPDTLYLLGPGTTLKAITDHLGMEKTLLGVDAIHGSQLVGRDINEQQILDLLDQYEQSCIIVTPIGGNGFIFGRGSKQFTPEVITGVGTENILIVGTGAKVRSLNTLRVDTGDPELDRSLSGYIKVIIDYNLKRVIKVQH